MDYEQYRASTFSRVYRCYSVSSFGKAHLEHGDKVVMPASALEVLVSMYIDYPMLFKLCNPDANRVSHCGVMEFSADEGAVYLPHWMMENMCLEEGGLVHVKNVSLPKGTYVKLQPHTKDFLDLSNPKAVLEKTLRSFSCLTIGDKIMVGYNNKNFYIDIVETKPHKAVSIIDTDCEVDFAPPLDYEEPAPSIPAPSIPMVKESACEDTVREGLQFIPFTGVARRLRGECPSQAAQPASSHVFSSQKSEVTNRPSMPRESSGKLVFGSKKGQVPKETPKVSQKNKNPEPQEEKLKFQAFTGKKYLLRE